MDEVVQRVLGAQGGAGSARQLRRHGVSKETVARLVRVSALVRVRQDALVLATSLTAATPWERSELLARAVGHSLCSAHDPEPARGTHALSHRTALGIRSLPYWPGGDRVHLVRTDGRRGRQDRTVVVHQPVDEEWIDAVDGIRTVRPVLAALQIAASEGVEAGLVALDGVLHAAEELDRARQGRPFGRCVDGPEVAAVRSEIDAALNLSFGNGLGAVRRVVELADGGSASVGESRSRYALHTLDLGPFLTQFPVRTDGVLLGLADLKLSRWKVLVEFDGQVKYSATGALFAEKLREDQLRDLGYEVVRITWADLEHPARIRTKILAAIARAERAEVLAASGA